MKNITVIHSGHKKSAGIRVATQALFGDLFPIYTYNPEDPSSVENLNFHENIGKLGGNDVVLFSGFDEFCEQVAAELKKRGVKIAVYWHFSVAIEVDEEIGRSFAALKRAIVARNVDLFLSCRGTTLPVMQKLFGVKICYIANTSMVTPPDDVKEKRGIGIYSGSTNYWAKNLYTGIYGALYTGRPIDIFPYEPRLQELVEQVNATERVTGDYGLRIPHEDFLKRMASRELVVCCSFTEAMPVMPIEALNMGTLALTGPNHDYWSHRGSAADEIASYLVVPKVDDPTEIARYIDKAIENRSRILYLYSESWKPGWDRYQKDVFNGAIDAIASL